MHLFLSNICLLELISVWSSLTFCHLLQFKRALVFTCLDRKAFENTVGKKRNLSFSLSVFYPFEELSAIFIYFEIVVCKLFQFRMSLKFIVWERVNLLLPLLCVFVYYTYPSEMKAFENIRIFSNNVFRGLLCF